ncbi:sugar phosphate isomerase/epimerase family protein [Alicyclobacillus fastidiosus]|uniref:Sugar phosphate isomerase/epimerase n=1 Tax=Alicyclobacillus fastidiosus TaxID=392011 RepID=A0ABV5AJN4_9BACL|nr:sugar phosphate isomerase/epimerase [Alicyclobacillus fastidiosus]WEH08268.1 sugar phosphate isomerase/epimerase [Alicyclobacillus fastidiosus]
MRLGGPIFEQVDDLDELVKAHQRLGYSAAYCKYVKDPYEREEYKQAFQEADIVLAELGAYCISISEPDPKQREMNIQKVIDRLCKAEEMGAKCCVMHGGSYNTDGCVQGHPDNFSEANIEHNVRVIQRILDEVQPVHTKLVLETESYVLPDSPDLYLQLFNEVNRPGFGMHLDPVNMIISPRHFYYNGDFVRECFAKMGPHIVSCHAKDTTLVDHATVQISETFVGNGFLDYDVYLSQLMKLPSEPPLMIEHLSQQELPRALNYLFSKADELGFSFKHSELREEIEPKA